MGWSLHCISGWACRHLSCNLELLSGLLRPRFRVWVCSQISGPQTPLIEFSTANSSRKPSGLRPSLWVLSEGWAENPFQLHSRGESPAAQGEETGPGRWTLLSRQKQLATPCLFWLLWNRDTCARSGFSTDPAQSLTENALQWLLVQ
jgi:hypothetical protein